jgi:hypothetical protein
MSKEALTMFIIGFAMALGIWLALRHDILIKVW